MKELKQLEDYYKDNEIDIDQIIEDFAPYITTIINNGTVNNNISFEDKEEIFSETFFILWKNRNRLNINVSLNSYLAGITRNLIKEKYRKLKVVYDISDFENDILNSVNMYESDRELIYDIEQKVKNLKSIDIEIVNLFYYSSMSVKDIAGVVKDYDLVLLAYELEENNYIKNELLKIKGKNEYNIAVIIGPEGGLEVKEVELLQNAGCKVISLGSRILRTETVCLQVSSIIMYELEENGGN